MLLVVLICSSAAGFAQEQKWDQLDADLGECPALEVRSNGRCAQFGLLPAKFFLVY